MINNKSLIKQQKQPFSISKTEGLDVTITDQEFGPKDFQTISISGYVTNDTTKEFTASVEYANNYHIGAISTTKNLELKTNNLLL